MEGQHQIELSKALGEIAQLKDAVSNLYMKNVDLLGKVGAMEREMTKLEKANEELRSEMDDMSQEISNISKKNTKCQNEMRATSREMTKLEKANEELRSKMDDMSQEHRQTLEVNGNLQRMFNRVLIGLQNKLDEQVKTKRPSTSTSGQGPGACALVPPAKVMSPAEIKVIKEECWIDYIRSLSHPVEVKEGDRIPVRGFDVVILISPFMDASTGRFSVPVYGKYRFGVGMGMCGGIGKVESYLCSSRNGGERELMDTCRTGDYRDYKSKELVLGEGEEVWVEVVGVQGKCRVWVGFGGDLVDVL